MKDNDLLDNLMKVLEIQYEPFSSLRILSQNSLYEKYRDETNLVSDLIHQNDWINEKTIFIGKKENLLEDINKLLDLLQLEDLKVKKLKFRKSFRTAQHESEGIPYMDLYDEKMIKIVNEIYEQDFVKFGYEML